MVVERSLSQGLLNASHPEGASKKVHHWAKKGPISFRRISVSSHPSNYDTDPRTGLLTPTSTQIDLINSRYSNGSDAEESSSQDDSETASTTSSDTTFTSNTTVSTPDATCASEHDFREQPRPASPSISLEHHYSNEPLPKVFDATEQDAVVPRLEKSHLEDALSAHGPLTAETVTKSRLPQNPQPHSQAAAPVQNVRRINRCRRRSTESTASQPPSLKRDTDTADFFVHQLIAFTCRLITAIWPLAATPPMMTACFNGAGVLPLHTFIYETLRRSKTSYSTLQIALYYLVMLKPKLPGLDFTKEQPTSQPFSGEREAQGCRAMQCGRRMFLSALMLASKYIQDRNYSTRAWSKISGLRIPEINDNEREYLKLIDYDLHLKQETFENWSKVVLLLSRISKFQPNCLAELLSFGSGYQSEPGAEVSTACPSSRRPELYSDTWWKAICRDLKPEMFRSSAETDAFVKQRIPLDHVGITTHMPPIPPRTTQGLPDMTFIDQFGSSGPPSNVSTPVQMTASSPAQSLDLPMRPQPRKLQTPQSTPGGPDFHSGSGMPQGHPRLPRTSASVDALRTTACARRAYNASLDRCPPPQPQHTRSLLGPQELAHPLLGLTSGGYRSRSNSSSSSSSLSSHTTGHYESSRSSCSPLAAWQKPPTSQPQPCLSNQTTDVPTRPLRRKPGFRLAETSHYEGVETGTFDGTSAVNDDADAIAASALVDLRVADRESLTPKPSLSHPRVSRDSTPKASQQRSILRGHKRTISKANDDLHDNVRLELLQAGSGCDIIDNSNDDSSATESEVEEKQIHVPYRQWAPPRRPVLKPQYNKRQACGLEQRHPSAAAERASSFLKPGLERYVSWDGSLSY